MSRIYNFFYSSMYLTLLTLFHSITTAPFGKGNFFRQKYLNDKKCDIRTLHIFLSYNGKNKNFSSENSQIFVSETEIFCLKICFSPWKTESWAFLIEMAVYLPKMYFKTIFTMTDLRMYMLLRTKIILKFLTYIKF